MKRFVILFALLSLFLIPRTSKAYIGAGLGVVDESNFGYGLLIGMSLPWNLQWDNQLMFTMHDEAVGDVFWMQGNIDLAYDFNHLFKDVTFAGMLHPYFKGGFTYAGAFVNAGATTSTEASHGPGFNFGAGLDWKLLPFMTVGFDITQAFVYLNGITITDPTLGPVLTSPDTTAKVFNALATVKFFAY